jgi:hypothetical protein
MGRPSPRFGPDPIQWRAYVRRVHPVTAMAQYLRRLLRGEVLPSFHFTGEPAVDFVALSWPLDELLLEAALRKLAAQCRVPIAGELDALIAGGIVRVIRANPDRALRLVGEARAWAVASPPRGRPAGASWAGLLTAPGSHKRRRWSPRPGDRARSWSFRRTASNWSRSKKPRRGAASFSMWITGRRISLPCS